MMANSTICASGKGQWVYYIIGTYMQFLNISPPWPVCIFLILLLNIQWANKPLQCLPVFNSLAYSTRTNNFKIPQKSYVMYLYLLYLSAKYQGSISIFGGDIQLTSDQGHCNSLLASIFWSEYCILLVLCISTFGFKHCLNPLGIL